MRVEDIDKIYWNDEIKAKIADPEIEPSVKLGLFNQALSHYRERAIELEPVPAQIDAFLREHELDTVRSVGGFGTLERLKGVLQHYRGTATNALASCERFRDDLHAWLRGMVITLEMTGNAGTHHEKNARLRGAIELTEAVITKVINERFNFDNYYWRWKDTFHSDFPTREILDQKHRLAREVEDLKRQLAEAKGVPVEELQTESQW